MAELYMAARLSGFNMPVRHSDVLARLCQRSLDPSAK